MTIPLPVSAARISRVLALLCAALLLSPLGCRKKADPDDAPAGKAVAAEVTVQAAHPTQAPISEQIAADATLAPLAQAALAPKVTAPVKRFYVQRGSQVRAGQLLVTLENSDLAAAALDNKGTYTAAQGSYALATRSQVPGDLTKAQTDLAQAKANLDLNQSIVNGRTALFSQGAIPGRDLDTAKAALVQAKAAYDVARQHAEATERVGNQAALETARGQLVSAKGKFLGAEAQLSYTQIRSPINGVVTDRPLFNGETAAAGTAVVTVMDTSSLIAKLHVAQDQAQRLKLGAAATLMVPGISDPTPATVSLISPALDPGSTTVEVWLRVPNPHRVLKAGTPVHASITGRTVQSALLVPVEAIQTATDGTKYVLLAGSDNTAKKRIVTIGIQTPELDQVLTGLTPEETVIAGGAYGLDDGTKIKIGVAEPDPGDKKSGDAAETRSGDAGAGVAGDAGAKPNARSSSDRSAESKSAAGESASGAGRGSGSGTAAGGPK